MKRILRLINSYIAILILCNCGEYNDEKEYKKENEYDIKANLPKGFITNKDLGIASSILDTKKNKLTNKTILLSGYIGGRREPFTKGRASFVVIDNSIKKCDEIKGDNCPTPWDACCEDRRTILSSTLTVQIIDENSSLLKGTLKDVDGLQPGKRIKVLGTIDTMSIPSAMLVNAIQIQLL